MKKKPKKKTPASNKSKLKVFGISAIITILFHLILFLIAAFICFKSDISNDKYFIIMMILTAISSLFGGYRLTSVNKEKGLINGFLGAVPITLFTLIFALLYNNGIPTITTLIPCIISVMSGLVSGTFAINLRR